MIVTMIAGFAIALPLVRASGIPQPDAYIIVDPPLTSFPPPSVTVGSTFDINVSLVNITNVAGISWELAWNPALLACTSITEEIFHYWTISTDYANINDLVLKYNNTAGTADYSQTWLSLSTAATDGSIYPGYVNDTDFPSTNGTYPTATLSFKILQLPTISEGNLTCPFGFNVVKIGDPLANKLIDTPSDTGNPPVNGTYIVYWAAPTILPYYSVSSFTATTLGQVFNISVYLNNLDAGWEAVGFEFTLLYNASLMNYISWSPGPWLPPFGTPPDQGILPLLNYIMPGEIEIGEVVLPETNGTWATPFPSAPNPNPEALAEFTFNATMQGVFPTTLSCPLTFTNLQVANWLAQPIGMGPEVDGLYVIQPSITGREIDIYTQWPAPYGGQGLDQPSDMFWPQKSITLYANVTYNGWAEQQKEVAFQIIAPNTVNMDNETWAILYATTNASGIASVTFTLPWPCDDPQQWFGVWTVIGTVDIACTIVNDTLWFHYDYLTEIFKQTTDMTSYTHEDVINVTIDYGTYLQETDATYYDPLTNMTMALGNVTVVVTGLDNLLVPFTFIGAQIPLNTSGVQYGNASILEDNFGGAPATWTALPYPFSNYINYTVSVTISIPKYAAAGEAVLECAILNTWPSLGGTVISGYYDPTTMTWLPYCPTYIDILAS